MGRSALNIKGKSAPVRIHLFERDAVVYNSLSGETHLLEVPIARLLQSLISGCSNPEVLQGVLRDSGWDDAGEISAREQVRESIAEFQRLRLLPCPGKKEG